VSILIGYNVVKLGVRYPSSGGLIEYLVQGFGNGRLVGIASWLGYFSAIVIVGAMVAVSFGSYATSAIAAMIATTGSRCPIRQRRRLGVTTLVYVLIARVAGYRLRSKTGAHGGVVLVGMAVTAIVLGFFAVDTVQNAPETFFGILGVGLLAVVLDFTWSRLRQPPAAVLEAPGNPSQ
jgi:amino acid transporter